MSQVSSRYLPHTHTGTFTLKCNHKGLRVCRMPLSTVSHNTTNCDFFPLSSLRLTTVNVIILKLLGWGRLATKRACNDIVAPCHSVVMLLHAVVGASTPNLCLQTVDPGLCVCVCWNESCHCRQNQYMRSHSTEKH